MKKILIPIEDAAELLQAYDSWKGHIPWDIDEGESQREYMERFSTLRNRLIKEGIYENDN